MGKFFGVGVVKTCEPHCCSLMRGPPPYVWVVLCNLPKCKMEPENGTLEWEIPFVTMIFRFHVQLGEGKSTSFIRFVFVGVTLQRFFLKLVFL